MQFHIKRNGTLFIGFFLGRSRRSRQPFKRGTPIIFTTYLFKVAVEKIFRNLQWWCLNGLEMKNRRISPRRNCFLMKIVVAYTTRWAEISKMHSSSVVGKWEMGFLQTPPSKVGAAAYISANENGNERTRILRLKIRLGLSWKRCVLCRLAAVSKTQFGFKAREFRVMVYYYTTLLLTIFMRR